MDIQHDNGSVVFRGVTVATVTPILYGFHLHFLPHNGLAESEKIAIADYFSAMDWR